MPKGTIELMNAILSFTKVTMMERERARRQIEPQLRSLRGSLQLNSSRSTFKPFRAFVAEKLPAGDGSQSRLSTLLCAGYFPKVDRANTIFYSGGVPLVIWSMAENGLFEQTLTPELGSARLA
jgi:hypothetical protein